MYSNISLGLSKFEAVGDERVLSMSEYSLGEVWGECFCRNSSISFKYLKAKCSIVNYCLVAKL